MHPHLSPSDIERFWSHVDKDQECWLWTASPREICPRIMLHGRRYFVSRLAYELAVGPIADGLLVCHRCDTPRCCRPEHLFLGTPADNAADRNRKGRHAHGDRHFSRLHPEKLARGAHNGKYTKPERTPRGERHGRAKVTQAMVDEIRHRAAAGEYHYLLAREFGLARSTVSRIVKREIWA